MAISSALCVTTVLVITTALFTKYPWAAGQTVNVSRLYPETLQDELGNTADKYSNISFVPIQDNQEYKAGGDSSSDLGAVETFYSIAESIVDTSLPGELPYELISGALDGDFSVLDDWQGLLLDYLGYAIAVVIGFIFFIVFPIVGFCICCCRCCCGNCGGKRMVDAPEEAGHGDTCGRTTALLIVSLMVTMALAGSAMMFVTNENLSSSIKDFGDNQIDKIDDVTSFFNSTVHQAEQLVGGNYNFTLEVLFRDLDNIGYLLGGSIRDRVLASTNLGQVYDDIDQLDLDAQLIYDQLIILQDERANVLQSSEHFHNFTTNMKTIVEDYATKYPDFNSNVTDRNFVTAFDPTQLPKEDLKILALNQSLSAGVTSMTEESRQNLEDIPERVQNDTEQARTDLKAEVENYRGEISSIIDDIRSLKDDFLSGTNFDDMIADGKDFANTAEEYDQYRWYAGIGLASVMSLIVLLKLLGVVCGCCGSKASTLPQDRSTLSNCGGNLLIAGVVLTFILGWLTMFVTTILFTVGAPVEKFVCGPLNNLEEFDKLINEYDLLGSSSDNGSWLGDQLYSGKGVQLDISGVLKACEEGQPIYKALKMDQANVFNLSSVTDYTKSINISKQLEGIDIDFSGINITTGPLIEFLDFMKKFDSQMNYTGYNDTLSEHPVEPSIIFLDELKNYTNSLGSGPEKDNLTEVVNAFESELQGQGGALNQSIANIQQALLDIKNITQKPVNNNLTKRSEDLEEELRNIEQNLSSSAEQAFQESVKEYESRITKIIEAFADDVVDAVKNDLGICTPLWNMYSDVLLYGICDSMVGSLGGWWLASGMTAFFLTMSVCASLKLVKHFRRMEMGFGSQSSVHHFQNKVFHADHPNGKGMVNNGFEPDSLKF